jgi:methylmalonyl-CoA mutase, N-terminal domain
MEILFEGIDLARISTSFTINGTAAIILRDVPRGMADKQGVPREKLTGTIQNDILKEYVARGTWIFPVRPSMRSSPTPCSSPTHDAALQSDLHRRRARARCRLHRGRGDGLHAGERLAYVDELIAARRRPERVRQAAVVLLLCAHGSLRGGLPSSAPPAALGAHHEGALRHDRPEGADVPLRRGLRRIVARRAQPYNNIVRVGVETWPR